MAQVCNYIYVVEFEFERPDTELCTAWLERNELKNISVSILA